MTTKTAPQFSVDWFDHNIRYWKKVLKPFKKQPTDVLEIGVFEGRATVWLLNHILLHPESKLTAIDTFEGSMEFKHKMADILETLQERFLANVAATGREGAVETIKSDSFSALIRLHAEKREPFDLIYVDGSHMARDVLSDAILAWPLLKSGGILIFDDYLWDVYPEPYKTPRPAVDAFLACFPHELEVLHSKYQVIVRKH